MKLKSTEDDFIVEEINDSLAISDRKDNFRVYSVEKKGIETFALIGDLSRRSRIPQKDFGIAGLKDKHALTKQFMTIPVRYDLSDITEKNLRIRHIGFTSKKLNIGDLEKNRFTIIARDIKKGEIEGILKKAEDVKLSGIPNYFDSQRFGSVGLDRHTGKFLFIERFVVLGDFENACKIFLTNYQKTENKRIKDCKRLVATEWENIRKKDIRESKKILPRITEVTFRQMLEAKTWHEAFMIIPGNLREMYVSAYQSYIWNECVKSVLKEHIDKKNLINVDYSIGKLTYYKNLVPDDLKAIPKAFPLISEKTMMDDAGIIKRILDNEEITLEMLDVKEKTGNFFKEYQRNVLVHPEGLTCRIDRDEINDNDRHERYKAVLAFALGKGSYATCVTKKLFNE